MSSKDKIQARPTTKIYTIFSNFNYRLETAIPEFLDNSIASFRKNEVFFKKNKIKKRITIIFDAKLKRVIIRDNAFGITKEELPRVVRLQDVPKDNTGLNEFGMGLKAAGFWLGQEISLYTKSPKSKTGYSIHMSLDKFSKGIEEVPIEENNIYNDSPWFLNHGTVVMIEGVIKDLSPKSLRKLLENLGSKYRNDINQLGVEIRVIAHKGNNKYYDMVEHHFIGTKNEIKLSWGGTQTLKWKEPKYWIDEDTNKPYYEQFEFDIEKDGKTYNVTGVVAIKEKGSRRQAGFDLLRRGRVIVEKYRREELIGGASDFSYQRLFGYFNLDNFPVTQQKDNFAWENGLEQEFINKLSQDPKFIELKYKSGILRKRTKIEAEKVKTNNYISASQNHFSKIADNVQPITSSEQMQILANLAGFKHIKSDVVHELTTNSGTKILYSRLVEKRIEAGKWITWINIKDEEKYPNKEIIVVELDINHPFFNLFNDDNNFLTAMRLFGCCFALAGIDNDIYGGDSKEFIETLGWYLEENTNAKK